MAVCDEKARKREIKNGKVPRWFVPHPNPTNKSLPKMWDNFLNRKRWTVESRGPVHSVT